MSRKFWDGRFSGKTSRFLEEFTASIQSDVRMYREDIEGSIAHVKMLGRQGIIAAKEARAIERGLREILKEFSEGKIEVDPSSEDIHMYVERALHDKIGEVAGKLHTARSRNDQVATDLRLFLARVTDEIVNLVEGLQLKLAETGYRYRSVIMPAYTHLQRAQPVLFAHHLLAYYEMLARDRERFFQAKERILTLPLGSAACTGTSFNIDRDYVRRELGFRKITENSVDAVSDRDFVLEFLFTCSVLMMHLSRLCEEIVIWSSSEFGFIELPDDLCTGSSIMPQKKNPDMAELVRGKTGRVYGSLVSLLTVMKGLPLSYNRDLQEDKPPLFDTIDTVSASLRAVALMVAGMKPKEEKLSGALVDGYPTATDLADYLTGKGVPFRKAHGLTGKIVAYCLKEGKALEEVSLEELRRFSEEIGSDVFLHLSPRQSVASKNVPGGTAPGRVSRQLRKALRKKR
ncbi:MAG: argininosuccinate lyase [Deltaproteobacteria bacterium]|nr:argininosuccinate lyase [Deltaproteobacteria bacterium]NIS76395.1 argininosuccinate lyase [Deltaproteobacteria bacterium]